MFHFFLQSLQNFTCHLGLDFLSFPPFDGTMLLMCGKDDALCLEQNKQIAKKVFSVLSRGIVLYACLVLLFTYRKDSMVTIPATTLSTNSTAGPVGAEIIFNEYPSIRPVKILDEKLFFKTLVCACFDFHSVVCLYSRKWSVSVAFLVASLEVVSPDGNVDGWLDDGEGYDPVFLYCDSEGNCCRILLNIQSEIEHFLAKVGWKMNTWQMYFFEEIYTQISEKFIDNFSRVSALVQRTKITKSFVAPLKEGGFVFCHEQFLMFSMNGFTMRAIELSYVKYVYCRHAKFMPNGEMVHMPKTLKKDSDKRLICASDYFYSTFQNNNEDTSDYFMMFLSLNIGRNIVVVKVISNVPHDSLDPHSHTLFFAESMKSLSISAPLQGLKKNYFDIVRKQCTVSSQQIYLMHFFIEKKMGVYTSVLCGSIASKFDTYCPYLAEIYQDSDWNLIDVHQIQLNNTQNSKRVEMDDEWLVLRIDYQIYNGNDIVNQLLCNFSESLILCFYCFKTEMFYITMLSSLYRENKDKIMDIVIRNQIDSLLPSPRTFENHFVF